MRLRRHWMLVWVSTVPSYQHSMPVNDAQDHEPTTHCACFPRKLLLEDGPHVVGVQFQHNAFDGRLQ